MSPVIWRWEERDFGFRFRTGRGKQAADYYQSANPNSYYTVPTSQRKLEKERADALARSGAAPAAPLVVANPWRNYQRDWDWIETEDGLCLNYAGCLDREELARREDEGVQRAMELVASVVGRVDPVQLTIRLIQQLHQELMGAIYPFAGLWRTVSLHKGDGPTKWPLPPGGIAPLMEVFERDVLCRSPMISDDDGEVFFYVSEVMCELLGIHPFREGNGRTAFILCNLVLMQNGMLPLTTYERRRDEKRYLAACEAGRIKRDYGPLASLLAEWEDQAHERWSMTNG